MSTEMLPHKKQKEEEILGVLENLYKIINNPGISMGRRRIAMAKFNKIVKKYRLNIRELNQRNH
ncbi:hypothetical protein [Bacillus sp. Marseille-Q3570]|uniref:hypothetical protein n=1 Tax=Bacillus sp. Marseille-Q3570 TaxID=2963522 RepID=UPI0021B73C15|nr:hypothetical protein [Bacillus sp. Marseille-Q3570]